MNSSLESLLGNHAVVLLVTRAVLTPLLYHVNGKRSRRLLRVRARQNKGTRPGGRVR